MKPTRNAALALVPGAFLVIFFVYPVASLIARGLGEDIDRLGAVLTGSRFLRIAWFTTWQAAASTALTLIVAWPLTWALANRRLRGRALIRVLVTIPFVLPTVVVGGAFIAVIDRFGLDEGVFRLRHTVWAILFAHVFFNVAVIVRSVGGFWSQLDRSPEDAARTLGASPWQAFVAVTVPRLRGAVAAAASIVFLFSFTSFAIVLFLGGPRRSTLDTEIYRWAVTRTDPATAAALAVVQLVAVAALLVLNERLQRRVPRDRVIGDRAVRPVGWRAWTATGAAIAVPLGLLAIPVVTLVVRSLRFGDHWSLQHFSGLNDALRIPVTGWEAIVNSLSFAVVAAGIAVVIGGLGSLAVVHGPRSVSRVLDLGLLLPLGTSAVTLGFGMLISLDRGVLDLRSSWMIVPLAQALIAVPFVVRAVVPVLRAIDPATREAARTLGASSGRVRREIDLPVAARALATGLGFSFAISLGEFGATSFLGRRTDLMTVPLAIGRLLGAGPGEVLRGQAMALSVVLMVMTAVVVLVADRLHPRGGALL